MYAFFSCYCLETYSSLYVIYSNFCFSFNNLNFLLSTVTCLCSIFSYCSAIKDLPVILSAFPLYWIVCLFFSSLLFSREIEACCHLLASLCSCFEQTLTIKAKCQRGSLFPPGEHRAIGLFNMSACVNQYSFYGRCIGFHVGHTHRPTNFQFID